MPTTPLPYQASDFPGTLWFLLGLILFLQVIGLLHRLVLGARLRRIERQLASGRKPSSAEPEPAEPASSESEQAGLFEEFLSEDPQRRLLSKKEQFEGFRKWRKERGLNWSK